MEPYDDKLANRLPSGTLRRIKNRAWLRGFIRGVLAGALFAVLAYLMGMAGR